MVSPKETLHERVRTATRTLHDALEREVRVEERIRSRSAYIGHLIQLWRLHLAVELGLHRFNFAPFQFAYPFPYRAALLEADLEALGVSPATLTDLALPSLPPLPTSAAALGCVYVVEGSAKGARVLLTDIKEALGLDAQCGASFFAGRTKETGPLWRAALTALNEIPPHSPEGDMAVTGAIETFGMFREGLLDRAGEGVEPPGVLGERLRGGAGAARPLQRSSPR